MNRVEALQKLVAGEKLINRANNGAWFQIVDNVVKWIGDEEVRANDPLSRDCGYEIYKEPKKMVKWYEVISHHIEEDRPDIDGDLYRSKEDFLEDYDDTEDDYHWIDLRFVCEKEEVKNEQ